MKNLRNASPLFAVAVLTLTLSLSGCGEGLGIFADIAAETKNGVNATNEFKATSPSFVVFYEGTYYSGMGRLWNRKASDPIWTLVDTSSVSTQAGLTAATIYADSAVVLNGKLYVSFKNANGDSIGIWEYSAGAWTKTASSFPDAGLNVQGIFGLNGNLYASTVSNTVSITYSVYRLAGSAFTLTTGLDPLLQPNAMAWDGSAYWLCAGTKLYTAPSGSPETFTQVVDTSLAETTFTNIVYDETFGILATTTKGIVHQFSAATWKKSAALVSTGTSAYYLTQPLIVSFAGKKALLLGTDVRYETTTASPTAGYLEYDVTNMADITTLSTTPLTNKGMISNQTDFASSLGSSPVPRLVKFEADGIITIFACTGGHGLLSNEYKDSLWSKWRRETDK